jgi:riboflavin kinase/FMN adenylyltransferase
VSSSKTSRIAARNKLQSSNSAPNPLFPLRTTFDARELKPSPNGSVVSVGVFDGVHLGHRAILRANIERARELNAESTVLTFRRHPKTILLGRAPRTLTTLEHRLELFQRAGIEHAVALTFDEELRQLSAEDFAERYLVKALGARALVLGFDSKFGHGRRGTPALMTELGYDVEVVEPLVIAGRAISSTAIREAVELGDSNSSQAMLGRPVSVIGRVVRGDAIGRTIGFPTANLDLHHELHPPLGVYATQARILGEQTGDSPNAEVLRSVTNIGFRPTVANEQPTTPRVEVHIFDFDRDIYGKRLEISFIKRLRGEQRFDDLDGLVAQIKLDCEEARAVFD